MATKSIRDITEAAAGAAIASIDDALGRDSPNDCPIGDPLAEAIVAAIRQALTEYSGTLTRSGVIRLSA